MTEKSQQCINRIASPLVWLSILILLFLMMPDFIVCNPAVAAQKLCSALLHTWLAVPGLILGVMSTRLESRLVAWTGWTVIVFICWGSYRTMYS
ncbi:hypothetical protein EI77_01377 [Prosthecobacter fusiformis]|uniref:Uncharacterized protein n=1 Tax=Prosthecobacter fusiformis TaxID=48464 RepID=A0A4R7S3K9_9BACT|nr:hypothetical protein EI77_01377 [Prosthecobacter fusiformis]